MDVPTKHANWNNLHASIHKNNDNSNMKKVVPAAHIIYQVVTAMML